MATPQRPLGLTKFPVSGDHVSREEFNRWQDHVLAVVNPRLNAPKTTTGAAGGDLAGSYPDPTLVELDPSPAGTYGDGSRVPVVTVDEKGRVTSASEIAVDAPVVPWTLAEQGAPNTTGDEFDDVTIVPGASGTVTDNDSGNTWATNGTMSVTTAIDPTATPTSPAWNIDKTTRRSCLRVQPPVHTGITVTWTRTVALPSQCSIWCRVSSFHRSAIVGNQQQDNGWVALAVADDTSLTHFVRIKAGSERTGASARYDVDSDAGAFAAYNSNDWAGACGEYIGLFKDGTDYWPMFAYADGGWVFITANTSIAPITNTNTMVKLVLQFNGALPDVPGDTVHNVDFVRVTSGLTVP